MERNRLLQIFGMQVEWVNRKTAALNNQLPHAEGQETLITDWQKLQAVVSNCQRCHLAKTRTQTVFGVGVTEPVWMIIGEAPGKSEDSQGEPFVGHAGRLLDQMFSSIGWSRKKNIYIANILKCRPPQNRNPQPEEIQQCFTYLEKQIHFLKPRYLLLLGRIAAQAILNQPKTSMTELRGKIHHHLGIPTLVTYHPAYLLRSPREKSKAWEDLCLAKKITEKPDEFLKSDDFLTT